MNARIPVVIRSIGMLFLERGEPVNKRIPSVLEEIPAGYLEEAIHQGRVEEFSYETYDAFAYQVKRKTLHKKALVYLPASYDATKPYNVFYLMHGGGGNERTYLGNHPDFPRQFHHSYGFKNILDHAIEDGKIQPLIVVCPTYNNESDRDSWDFDRAIRLTSLFPRELMNDLVPAVESHYSTYAETVTEEGLRASRDHRGFGGFSMGSVSTWHVFDHCLKYFRFFLTMSGNCGNGSEQDAAVKRSGLGITDFFVFTATGTEDFAYSGFKQQVMNMGRYYTDSFRFADTQEEGKLSYRENGGAAHDYAFANQYIYNGLQFFWS